jgi:outer membrane protein OmpA-like peptidoglycan-associated protein
VSPVYDMRQQTGRIQVMAFHGKGGQPRSRKGFVQAPYAILSRLTVLGCLTGLSACSSHPLTDPETWWHQKVGGKIAEQRPPPPGAGDPYPNLSTIPARPKRPDAAAMDRMTAGLIADRTNARQIEALAPIAAQSASPTSAAVPFGAAPPPAQEPAASASLEALSKSPQKSPPPPAKNPRTTLSRGVQATPPDLGQPSAGPPSRPMPNGMPNGGIGGPLPPLPAEEPLRPNVAPAPPPVPLPVSAAPPPAPTLETGTTTIDFGAHSAALNVDGLTQIKELAASLDGRGIAITGHGDATLSDPNAQSDAVALGLTRAMAIARALVAEGVPNRVVRVNAEAAGRGASIRLLR